MPAAQRLAQLSAVSTRDLVFIASKWSREFLIVVAAIVAATIGYIAIFRTPLYESEARLFVRVSQEQQLPRTLLAPSGATLLMPTSSDVTSEIDLLLNADVLQQVIRGIDLEALTRPPPPSSVKDYLKAAVRAVTRIVRSALDQVLYLVGIKVPVTLEEALARQIRASLQVENTRSSSVLVVSFRWPDRDMPQFLLRRYIDTFMRFRVEAFDEGDASFFERQRNASSQRLADIEAQITRVRASAGIEDIDAQRQLLLGELSRAETAEQDAKLRLATALERLAAVRDRRLPGEGPLVLANLPQHDLLSLLDQQSVSVAGERLKAAALPRLDSREVEALDERYASLTAATVRALSDYADQIRATRDDAASRAAGVRARFATLAAEEPHWNQLQMDRKLALEEFERNSQRFAEAVGESELRRERLGNIIVIQEPTEATLAGGTRNMTLAALGGIFALFAGGAWIAIREFLDGRIWRSRDLEGIGVPVLASQVRRKSGPVSADFVAAAAAIRQALAAGTPPVFACMAVNREPPASAARIRALALALLEQDVGTVRVANAGRWDPAAWQQPGTAGLVEIDVPSNADGAALAAAVADADTSAETGDSVTLIAAEPLFSDPSAFRAALSAGSVVIEVTAGRDDAADVQEAVSWIRRNGIRVTGLILVDVPKFAKGVSYAG